MVLVDSNVLLRVLQRDHPMHKDAWRAVRALHQKKELVLAPQNIVELWVVATRPKEVNGLGVTPSRAAIYLARVSRTFPMLLETPDMHQEWQRLVVDHQVSGKKAHDARLVAAMRVHGVKGIVTFNLDDFRRYPGITVFHPRDLAIAS
jgi:predicted nucleic acid-binding protein